MNIIVIDVENAINITICIDKVCINFLLEGNNIFFKKLIHLARCLIIEVCLELWNLIN